MVYAIAGLHILGMLSILIEKTERSDTTNLQDSIVNLQLFPAAADERSELTCYRLHKTPHPRQHFGGVSV